MRFGFGALVATAIAATPVMARWRAAESEHFIVYSEQTPDRLRDLATKLERYDAGMRYLFKLSDTPVPRATRLTVYVVGSDMAVRRIYGANAIRGSERIMGFYMPRASGSIAFAPAPSSGGMFDLTGMTVLLHEYAHHMMMAESTAAYPAWFIEGFAEFCATAKFDADGSIGFGLLPTYRAYGLVRGEKLPITRLFSQGTDDLKSEQLESLYGRGWLLTHYLSFSSARAGQLKAYLEAINEGKSSLDAARGAFGDLAVLDRELDRYMLGTRMSYLSLKPSALKAGKVEVHELSDGENAIMPVRLRSRRGVDAAGAASVLPLARAAAAPYPKDEAAQLALAEAAFDAGDDAEADAAAERAIAVDDKSARAWLYRAWVAGRRADQAKAAADDPLRRTARADIVRANHADPDDPLPLVNYYLSFTRNGAKPSHSAVDGLARAYALVPQATQVRFLLARQRAIDGDFKDARQLLAPLAFDPHGGAGAARMAAIVRSIDEDHEDAALAALSDKPPGEDEDG